MGREMKDRPSSVGLVATIVGTAGTAGGWNPGVYWFRMGPLAVYVGWRGLEGRFMDLRPSGLAAAGGERVVIGETTLIVCKVPAEVSPRPESDDD